MGDERIGVTRGVRRGLPAAGALLSAAALVCGGGPARCWPGRGRCAAT